MTRTGFVVSVLTVVGACAGNPAQPQRVLTAAEVTGHHPIIDLDAGPWVIDGTHGPVDLTAIEVHTSLRSASAFDWIREGGGPEIGTVLVGTKLTIGGDAEVAYLYKSCDLICDKDGSCYEVCVIACEPTPDGGFRCPLD